MNKPLQQTYEKLGAFYLGKHFDAKAGSTTDDLLLYESKDLTTHAVCVGMTGSGKTGLCISLLEEAALDGIPALIIDPKGDMGNLLLNFPQLKPGDFEPWIEAGDATRKGRTVAEQAAATAKLWRDGLADWGQPPSRIRALRDRVDMTLYTPGSTAGTSLNILKSFNAPPSSIQDDRDALNDRIQSSVSGLMALLGLEADPLQSREHIFLSNILNDAWSKGKDLDLPALIRAIQNPPFQQLGVFDLESFYPEKERMTLALRLNSILAAPGFQTWMQGESLDIQSLLWTADGRPRLSILSIAHLDDSERMFFVTLLLNELISWMRAQPGTSSLRALLYMDEIFGFFPPTANPPSKKPMLTLLKQARAFGLGCVLSTQNPVDLDYKGLSNTGTWFIGRLQTERDKARVLDGLEGATASAGKFFDRSELEVLISGLGKRVFLMNNVHDDAPEIFQTRWALSYLRGPLTRDQIRKLTKSNPPPQPAPVLPQSAPVAPPPSMVAAPEPTVANPPAARPALPASLPQKIIKAAKDTGSTDRLVYRPVLFGASRLHFVKSTLKVDAWQDLLLMAPLPAEAGPVDWDAGSRFGEKPSFSARPLAGATYADLSAVAKKASSYTSWKRLLKDHLYQTETVTVWKCAALKATSKLGESQGDFMASLTQLAREQRDLAVEKMKRKYERQFTTARDRIRRAEEKIKRETAQYKNRKSSTAIQFGTTLLGAIFGRKALGVGTIGRAGTALRGTGRLAKEKEDIAHAEEALKAQTQKLKDLESRFEDDSDKLKAKYDIDNIEITEAMVRPRKSDIVIKELALTWTPWRVDANGIAEALF